MPYLTQAQVEQFRQRSQGDPVWFSENILGTPLWSKEKEILEAVRDHAEVAVRSCHASGKTFTSARVAHWWLISHEEAVVITTAPTFRQVKEILWREIRACAAKTPLYPKNAVLDTAIHISEKWFALGLSSDKAEQFQGFHSPHLLLIGDEASGIPEDIFQAMDGLTPERILLLGQPLHNQGRFADSFRNPNVKKVHISAFDSPNVIEGKAVIPGLITQRDVNRIKEHYGEDSDVYRVRVLGEFPRADSDTLIALDEVERAMNREVNVLPQWEKKLGVDVARYGNDRSALVVRHHEKVLRKDFYQGQDTMQIVGHTLRIAREERIAPYNVFVDVIGVGAGVADRLKEQGWAVNEVNVAESPKDTEHYANLRAEMYDKMKVWLKTAQLPKDDDFYEMANVKYKFTSKGQLLLESKEDMKKRGIDSPDVADALALTFTGGGRLSIVASPLLPDYDLNS